MSRLILFSGGVESTALLTLANKQDIILVIRDSSLHYPNNAYNQNSIYKISKYFDIVPEYVDIKMSGPANWTYQLCIFIHIASIWIHRRSGIKTVWYGLHDQEPKDSVREIFDRCVETWKLMHEDVKLEFPFWNLSKKEQWDMIPKEVQHYVSSCSSGNHCGKCRKCEELEAVMRL